MLDDLYQALILDHNRRPRNFGPLEGADREAHGRNPLCGDVVTVRLRLDGDRIADIRFEGSGCAISRASASVLTTSVLGHTTAEAQALFERFHALVTGHQVSDHGADGELPRALRAFGGVSRFPMRVKCASLAWHALHAALTEPAGDGPAPAMVQTE